MTCACCALWIGKKLNRIDGVVATVNDAAEKARVRYRDTVTPGDLAATVARTGCLAAMPPQRAAGDGAAELAQPADELGPPRTRLLMSIV